MLSVSERQQRALIAILSMIVINIPLGIVVNYYSQDQYLKYVFYISILLLLFTVLYLLISWLVKFLKTRNTFWNILRIDEKEIIDQYLEQAIDNLRFELKFNMQDDYVALSGQPGNPTGLLPQQAYEEKGSSGRINIKNLDQFLLSPSNSKIFIYGPPGSGKSTTLYKALINYSQKFIKKVGYYIPIYIHANDINRFIESIFHDNIKPEDIRIIFFIEFIIKKRNSKFKKFIALCKKKPALRFAIIIDALDEFLEKNKREKLFTFLSILLKSDKETIWILSCREEEYKAYADKLDVINIRIRPMNLFQIKKLLEKRLKSFQYPIIEQNRIRNTVISIAQAETEQETFLRNPYYLSLWLYQISYSIRTEDTDDEETRIPSIRGLHNLELKREIAKGLGIKIDDTFTIENSILKSQIEILSVLSFYLLKASLISQNLFDGQLKICTQEVFFELVNKYKFLEDNIGFDTITLKRLNKYGKSISSSEKLNFFDSEDKKFVEIVNQIQENSQVDLLSFNVNYKHFLIVISSILEQSDRYRLIDLKISHLSFSKFLNQRAGDYLAANFLVENNLIKRLIQQGDINFWLFRSLAIAIAISDNPSKLLEPRQVSEDPVLSTAVINGLSFIKASHKYHLEEFVSHLVDYLLSENNFSSSHSSYDPCTPLRSLRAVTRLSTNGYANYFTIPKKLFINLLKAKNTSISDAAAITLITYASRVRNRSIYWKILFNYFLFKSLTFELSWRSLNGFITAIYRGVVGDE